MGITAAAAAVVDNVNAFISVDEYDFEHAIHRLKYDTYPCLYYWKKYLSIKVLLIIIIIIVHRHKCEESSDIYDWLYCRVL